MVSKRRIQSRALKALLILLLSILIPATVSNGGILRPALATTTSGLGIWSTTYRSPAILNSSLVANSFVVLRLNVTGGARINGFDANVTWDPTVLSYKNDTLKGGIFDPAIVNFSPLAHSSSPGFVRWAGVVNGGQTQGNGIVFTFTLKVLSSVPGSTTVHIAKGILTQPNTFFPTLMDGFFSNIPGNSDLQLTSMNTTEETATLGDIVDIYVGIRNIGTPPMAGVVLTLTYNGTLPINSTAVGTVTGNTLMTAKVSWNTTSFPLGLYNLNATVTTSSPDSFSGDNSLLLEQVTLVNHDLAVTSIIAPPSSLVNKIVQLGAVLQNLGTVQDTANVTIMANSTIAGTRSLQLSPGTIGTVYIGWNATNVGTYVLKATVKPVPGEKNLANNNLTDGTILIESSFSHELALSGTLPSSGVVGDNVTLTFVVRNKGNYTESYVLRFFVGNQAILMDQNPIASHANRTVTLSWITRSYAPDTYTIKANVTLTGAMDEDPSNDNIGPSSFQLFAIPVAKFTLSSTAPRPGTIIVFDASSSTDTDSTIISYKWNFGDGSTGLGKIITHSYNATGTYQATLTVTDNNQVSNQSTVSVTVALPPTPPSISLATILAIAGGVAVAAGLASWFLIFRRRSRRQMSPGQKTP